MNHFIKIDDEGYFVRGESRLTDEPEGRALFQNLIRDDRGRLLTQTQGVDAWVEAYDQPLVAKQVIALASNTWRLRMPYGFEAEFALESLRVDDWDRFYGHTLTGIPFVLSPHAQDELFNLADSFDDDSITIGGRRYSTGYWLETRQTAQPDQESFWTQIYNTEVPGWELEAPSKPLIEVLPQLKIPKARVAVPGCGTGNDAAFLAQQGHLVTGFDVSEEAIDRARSKFGHIKNLELVHADVFELSDQYTGAFDLVFEHTCYCAISPQRRDELVTVWKRLLNDLGFFLGVFFTWDRPVGPPFGGSEWEIHHRLKSSFESLYWTRWRQSIENRQGYELVVFAKKQVWE